MSLETKTIDQLGFDLDRAKPGLLYDADHVTLVGKFTDELSTYRARKLWTEVLNNYFLLEPDRDFELKPYCSIDDNRFALSCTFCSACGRYAFWRLINRQAPEAEQKLGGLGERPQRIGRVSREKTAFILGGIEHQIDANDENKSLVERLLQLFK